MPALTTALYVTACLHGSLHGTPKDICHEFPIRAFDSVAFCTQLAPDAVTEWLVSLRLVNIDAFVPAVGAWRCAPRTAGE